METFGGEQLQIWRVAGASLSLQHQVGGRHVMRSSDTTEPHVTLWWSALEHLRSMSTSIQQWLTQLLRRSL